MARTTGPLMSLSASGSVAKTLTYAHWKGRPYVRQLVTPSNPRSQGQYYTRAMIAFLSQAWKNLNLVDNTAQASWDDLAKQGNFSPFNAMVKTNMMRWTQGNGAMLRADGAGTDTPDTFTSITPTGGVRQISVEIIRLAANFGFGYAIVVDPTNGATPAVTLTRDVAPGYYDNASTTTTRLIGQLDPGTYSIGIYQFTTPGVLNALSNVTQGITVT